MASMRENLTVVCEQQRNRPACPSAHSDQRFSFSLDKSIVNVLAMYSKTQYSS